MVTPGSRTETVSPATATTCPSTSGGNADFARRRRAKSKDINDDRCSALPLNPQRSPANSLHGFTHRRRKTKSAPAAAMLRLRTFCALAVDFIVLCYAFRSIQIYIRPTSRDEAKSPALQNNPVAPFFAGFTAGSSFETSLQSQAPDIPACQVVEPDEVTFTLALHLSDNRLWMLQHHCELWGVSAPISIALWTNIDEDEIMEKLKLMGCNPEYIHLQTLSPEDHSVAEYPINQLRNMALRGAVTTSHVLLLDVDFWESADLFDTLNSPFVRKALAGDPKLALVVPAFETQDLNCGTSSKCRSQQLYWMPRDFEDLVISLGSNKALPYDPTNFSRQGSTNYRRWMKQDTGELEEISCVSSNQYQPYMVVRLCDGLPPFQQRFIGHGRNNMAWMLHIRRLGYRLQQVGGCFVTHFPHMSSQAQLEWEKQPDTESSGINLLKYLRGRTDTTFLEFKKWLETNVEDASRVTVCEDFNDDESSLLV